MTSARKFKIKAMRPKAPRITMALVGIDTQASDAIVSLTLYSRRRSVTRTLNAREATALVNDLMAVNHDALAEKFSAWRNGKRFVFVEPSEVPAPITFGQLGAEVKRLAAVEACFAAEAAGRLAWPGRG